MKYLKKFSTHTEYEEARQNLILPNVSLCAQENEVHYNPISEKGLFWMEVNDGTNNYFWLVNESGSIISANLGSGFLGVKKDEVGNFEVTFADEFCNLYEVEDGTVGQTTLDFTYDGVDYHIDLAQSTITPNVSETIPLVTKCQLVDLGLPSGTKWGSTNLLATSQTDLGKRFYYEEGEFENAVNTIISSSHNILGGNWSNPSQEQFDELLHYTTSEWVNNFNSSGVNGMKFTSTNGNFIFLPAYLHLDDNYMEVSTEGTINFGAYTGNYYYDDIETGDVYYDNLGVGNTSEWTWPASPMDLEFVGGKLYGDLGICARPVFNVN